MTYKLSKWLGLLIASIFVINTAYAEDVRTVSLTFSNEEITKYLGLTFNYDLTPSSTNSNKIIVCLIDNADQASFIWPHHHDANPSTITIAHHPLILNEGEVIFISGETDLNVDVPAMIRHVDVKGIISIHTMGAGERWDYKLKDNNLPQPYHRATASCHYQDVAV